MQPVSVVLKDVLLLVRIAINLQVLVELYRIVTKKMVLQPTMLPASVAQLNVRLIPVSIVIHPLIFVIKYHAVIYKVLSKIQLRVGAVQQIVLLNLIAINQLILVERYHIVTKKMVLQPTMLPASVDQQNVLQIPACIVTNLSIPAQLCVATSMVLRLIQNNVHVDQPGVLLMLAFIALNLPIPAHCVLQ